MHAPMNFITEKGGGAGSAMDSTGVASPTARTTPNRSRRDTPGLVLPKVQMLSTNRSSSAQSPKQEDPVSSDLVNNIQKLPGSLPGKQFSYDRSEALVTATIRELELDIEPRAKNPGFSRMASERQIRLDKASQNRYLEKKVSKEEQNGRRTFNHPERLRTVTWPSLQYKLWIDTSNLSLHRLNIARRPVSITHSSSQSNRNFGGSSASSSRQRTGNDFRHKNAVDYPEHWHVNSSHVSRGLSSHAIRREGFAKNEFIDGKRPTSRVRFPRLPSRMGRNSLEGFLSNSKGELLRNLQVDPRLKSKLPEATTAADSLAPLQDSRTTALKLRGVVRNPDMEHREKVKVVKKVKISTQLDSRTETSRGFPRGSRTAAKKLSFKIPVGSSNWEREVEEIVDEQKWVHRYGAGKGVVDTDVAPPPAPLHLEGAYHIMKYIATK